MISKSILISQIFSEAKVKVKDSLIRKNNEVSISFDCKY